MDLADYHMWWKSRGAWNLRRLLMSAWDPIHVKDAPQAQDEYDGYLGQISVLLRTNAGVDAIAAYLSRAENHMGFSTPPARLVPVARRIAAWFEGEMRAGTHPCPCCGYRTLLGPSPTDDVCPVCFWQDDYVDNQDTEILGPNRVRLSTARENFRRYGAHDEHSRSFVRPPRSDEGPPEPWTPTPRGDD